MDQLEQSYIPRKCLNFNKREKENTPSHPWSLEHCLDRISHRHHSFYFCFYNWDKINFIARSLHPPTASITVWVQHASRPSSEQFQQTFSSAQHRAPSLQLLTMSFTLHSSQCTSCLYYSLKVVLIYHIHQSPPILRSK